MTATARPRSVSRLPLKDRGVLITRPERQSRPLRDALRKLGAATVAVPTIEIAAPRAGGPLDAALRRLDRYDWVVVTSVNGVRACVARARALRIRLGRTTPPRWGAVGPATAAELRRAGIRVAQTPTRYLTRVIGRELREVRGRRVLLPRADSASPTLASVLRERGASVDEVVAYHTIIGPKRHREGLRRALAGGRVDTIVFTSASTVHGLIRLLGPKSPALKAVALVCIGPVTAAALGEYGLTATTVATEHTTRGIVDALRKPAR
jgi:uroporphyrinogen III methyltransferase / synthase